jgi:hypothetical protein
MRIALLLLSALGCGDDDGGGDAGVRSDGGGADATASVCARGCVATIAAACTNGPATQAICEADCEMLRTGMCATEYEALLSCGEGNAVTCGADGRPAVAACGIEQSAFVMCLGGM